MSFPYCTGCGLCCKKAGVAVESAKAIIRDKVADNAYVREVAEFPFQYDATGRCENLTDDNRCLVYETRPDICRVDKTWEKHFSGAGTLEQYFQKTIKTCNSMMIEAGGFENYLIKE